MFGNSFYRDYEYSADDNILVLLDKINIPPKAKLFVVNLINNTLKGKFSYGKQYRMGSFNETKIKFPIKDKKIDFDFMKNFIDLIEIEHIAQLEAYLKASNLKNYILTNEEEQILKDFEDGKIEFKEFKTENIFEIHTPKKRFDANKVTISDAGNPYVVRTSLNNGIRGYINEDEAFLNEGNTISFGQDTATMFYQEKPYFTGDKIKILKSKNDKFNKLNGLFFVSAMTKSFSSFSWGSSSYSVKNIGNQPIKLPIKNNLPSYQLMEVFIKTIQKLVIKDVVLYADRKIKTTKCLVTN